MSDSVRFKQHWEDSAKQRASDEVVFGKGLSREWSRERDAQSFSELQSYLSLGDHSRILDVGSGPLARAEVQYCSRHEIVGLDISRTTVKNAKVCLSTANLSNVSFIVADSEFLPFQNQTFDFTLCIGTICHLPTKEIARKAVREMCRVTKRKIYIPWWMNRQSLLGVEFGVFLKLFDLLHIPRAQYLQFDGYREVCQVCGNMVTQLRYGDLFNSTWLFNFAPPTIKSMLRKIFEALNRFHRNNRLLLRFSTDFEVTLELGEKTNKMEVCGFHEFF
jgi:ubiquinone/menaquinone biosynthesis C-methylase UbiE